MKCINTTPFLSALCYGPIHVEVYDPWTFVGQIRLIHLLPMRPSIVAKNMANLLTTTDLHPSEGPEIWSGNQISTNLSTLIPIQTDEDGCPMDTQQFPQPTLILQKLVPNMGE